MNGRRGVTPFLKDAGADLLEAQDPASLGKGFEDLVRPVVAHQLPACDALAVEPDHSLVQEADGSALLLVSENYRVRQPCGVVDRVAEACGGALLPITLDKVPNPVEASLLLTTMWIRSPGV